MREREELKYSAEEKIVEDSESEEDESIKKTVADRREQIQKRLSIERQIPASTQKKEIVQEITEIKRHSMIDDKRALHEEEIIMQAPTDNTFKSSSMPETIIKIKTTRSEGGADISKTEFDKELQSKFENNLNGQTSHTVMLAKAEPSVNTKIEYDATVTEKSQKEITESLLKDLQSQDHVVTTDQAPKPKERTITTIRFLEQESSKASTEDTIDPELMQKLTVQKDKIVDFVAAESEIDDNSIVVSAKPEKKDDLIDPQLAAKLTAQIEKIQDFVEPEPDTSCPIKCEMKKTFSSDQIDSELSAKLSKQKEKAERIAEDESGIFESSTGDMSDFLTKDFTTEKTQTIKFMQKESSESVKQFVESKKSEVVHKTEEVITKTVDGISEAVESKKTELTEQFNETNVSEQANKQAHLESTLSKVETAKDGAIEQIKSTTLSHVKDIAEDLESTKTNIVDSVKERVTLRKDDSEDISEKEQNNFVSHLGLAASKVDEIVHTVDTKLSTVDTERPQLSTTQQDIVSEAERKATVVVDDILNVISQDSKITTSVRFAEDAADDQVDFTSTKKAEADLKSSAGPFSTLSESDEFYKTIEDKITKKLSQDMSARQDDIASQGRPFC